MFTKTRLTLATTLVCCLAMSACAPAKRVVVVAPANTPKATTAAPQKVVRQPRAQRVVRRPVQVRAPAPVVAPKPVAVAAPRPVQAAAPSAPAARITPAAVKPAKKDCSIQGTAGCPVIRSFGDEDSGGDGGGGGGGGGWGG